MGVAGLLFVAGVIVLRCSNNAATSSSSKIFLYVGNNGETTANIHPHAFDATTGVIGAKGTSQTAGNAVNAIAFHPNNKFLYTAGDQSIHGYNVDATTGELSAIAGSPFSVPGAISVSVSADGTLLYAVAVGTYQIYSFFINQDTGALISVGLTTTGAGAPSSVIPHHNGKFLYAINNGTSTISLITVNSNTGAMTPTGSPVAAGVSPFYGLLSLDGRFLYTASQGGNTVIGFPINPITGVLGTSFSRVVSSGPVTLERDPTNSFLYVVSTAGGGGGKLEVLSINQTTGILSATSVALLTSPSTAPPSTLRTDPTGKFLLSGHYLASGQSQVDVYSIETPGSPVLISGSPFNICTGILAMVLAKLTP